MSVKIRLTRMGKKKQPTYRVVVMDSRKPRDGAYLEQIGRYDPRQDPSIVEIDNDRAVDWLEKGAQPTERARKLLEISGAWTRFRVSRGDIHTISEAEAEVAETPAPEPAEPEHTPEVHVVGEPLPDAPASDAATGEGDEASTADDSAPPASTGPESEASAETSETEADDEKEES